MSTTEPRFNIASMKLCTEALGPGRRMAIWFQGCNLGCKGCCNPELQPFVPRHIMGMSEILRAAEDAKRNLGIEGVTFIGGEPTLQSGLPALARSIHSLDLGIIMFTGRRFSELEEDLIENLDLIIDGRFEIDNRDYERNLIGSRNQKMINVSERYSDNDWFSDTRCDYIEIDVDGDRIISNGSAY